MDQARTRASSCRRSGVRSRSRTSTSANSTPFNFAFVSSADFRIDWQNSAFNVGMDNITFESAAAVIPESGSYALVMAGLALLGFVTKRRIAV